MTDPADVKPGEAWRVKVQGLQSVGVRDGDGTFPWSIIFLEGGGDDVRDSDVTLVSRLVPAPRVITNPDELDRLAARSVILSTDGQSDVYQKDHSGEWLDVTAHGYSSLQVLRIDGVVTVLWEPEA